jgi:hypothetical protein
LRSRTGAIGYYEIAGRLITTVPRTPGDRMYLRIADADIRRALRQSLQS